MNLQSILYASIFLFTHLNSIWTKGDENADLVVSQSGVDGVTPCGIGLKFFVELNNTSDKYDYEVQVSADQCCLEADGSLDCDVLEIIGDCVGFIPKGAIRTVRMIAPILDPLERRGYCILYLDFKCSFNGKNKRDTVKIRFDTSIENVNKIINANIKPCKSVDEDPLNDCEPVDCDPYYNTRKPHYNGGLKRCVATPSCLTDIISDLPNSIYDPVANRCIEGKSIKKRDVRYLKKIVAKQRPAKDVFIIKQFEDSTVDNKYSTVENANIVNAIDEIPLCPKCKKSHVLNENSKYSENAKLENCKARKALYVTFLLNYLKNNRCTLTFFGILILLQCCVIVGMVYYFTKTCSRCKHKKLVRKFFNYRQDASMTTPLIGTSNMDTETDYQFQTESSDVEKKIKCYKACQKENNVKMTMSDDILSKCVNRRNWNRQDRQAEVILEAHNEAQEIVKENAAPITEHQPIEPKKHSETKVVIEEELHKIGRQSKNIGSIPKCLNKEIIEREKEDIEEYDSSEQEIQCHSYNNNINSTVAGYMGISGKSKKINCKAEKNAVSRSTEKEAQAEFSNDSIDDYLSERGIYLVENISKYSFPSDTDPAKTSSPALSSKTSKNNLIKNVISLLQKKSRTNTSSDPGSKGKDNLDIKLLHMSRASICSTSNDSECIKCKQKDSRTSM